MGAVRAPTTVHAQKDNPGDPEILLINAAERFAKGRPENYLTDDDLAAIADVHYAWRTEPGSSAIITREEAARNDCNLSSSRYVIT